MSTRFDLGLVTRPPGSVRPATGRAKNTGPSQVLKSGKEKAPGACRTLDGGRQPWEGRLMNDLSKTSDPETMGEHEAREVVTRINHATEDLIGLITRAWEGRAWIALGYSSWADLCDSEIVVPKLDRANRVQMVGALRSLGMSTRAIAGATGTPRTTVLRDLESGGPFGPPDGPSPAQHVPSPPPAPITGTDGKTYSPQQTAKDASAIADHIAAELPELVDNEAGRRVQAAIISLVRAFESVDIDRAAAGTRSREHSDLAIEKARVALDLLTIYHRKLTPLSAV